MASDWVSILVDGQGTRAYAEQPKTTEKVPGIIVMMEAFGAISTSRRSPTDSPGKTMWSWHQYYITA
jgi:hypothetical protein